MMNTDRNTGRKRSRFRTRYDDYKSRGFFTYVGKSIFWIILFYAIFVLLVFLAGKYLLDFDRIFEHMLKHLGDRFVLILFFASESFLGLVPVDLFVIWTQKFSHPVPYLALLGVLSYAGAVISYGIGRWIAGMPRIKAYSERRLASYMDFTRKWGGAFIIIAALFPFTPFSMVVIALALLRYPFRLFLLYAVSRLVRFVIQGILFFDVIQMDKWITILH
jgi:membrane protein YqaA with SNARE-associated domain